MKLFSTVFTTLTLAGGMLLFNSASYKPSHEALAIVDAAHVTTVPVGLSRRRGAFNKAIDILADGAETDRAWSITITTLRSA